MVKKYILLLSALFITSHISAKEVTKETAVETATEILQQRVTDFSGTVHSVEVVMYEDHKSYYIINYSPQGWALISADDKANPLLGYSGTGNFQKNEQFENIQYWLDTYSEQIHDIRQIKGNKHPGWEEAKRPATRAVGGIVAPLITINWNQGSPFYKYCPKDAKGTAVVGCVAVAMAQAMSVPQYPARPVGSYSYSSPNYGTIYINYDNEPAYNWNNIMTGANSRDDVAKLLYHCGVAVDMNYGKDASGAYSNVIPAALKRNFSYPNSVKYYSRASYDGDWEQLIVNELIAGRAVCYNGVDTKKGYGHAFNLDGYDGSKMFHVNWGWGGSNNGYFSVDALKDATMGMDYTAQQGVVVGIRAPSEGPMNITLSDHIIQEGMPIGTYVADITVETEATNPEYTYQLKGPYSIILHDYMPASFTVENNKLYSSYVFNAEENIDVTVYIKVTNTNNNRTLEQVFQINVIPTTGINDRQKDEVFVAYNKANKSIDISPADAEKYSLYAVTGILVESKAIVPYNRTSFSVSHLPPGIYIVRLTGGTKPITNKITIN